MKRLGKCQVHGCNQPARYGLYRTTDGKKEWIYVCRRHESEMGYENLMRVGSYAGEKKRRAHGTGKS